MRSTREGDLADVYSFFREVRPAEGDAIAKGPHKPEPADGDGASRAYPGMRKATSKESGFDPVSGGGASTAVGWEEVAGGAGVLVRRAPAKSASEGGPTGRKRPGEVAYGIPESSKGYRLLRAIGWTAGQGLGAKGEGIAVPVQAVTNAGKRGLGTRGAVVSVEGSRKKTYAELRAEQKRMLIDQLGPGEQEWAGVTAEEKRVVSEQFACHLQLPRNVALSLVAPGNGADCAQRQWTAPRRMKARRGHRRSGGARACR